MFSWAHAPHSIDAAVLAFFRISYKMYNNKLKSIELLLEPINIKIKAECDLHPKLDYDYTLEQPNKLVSWSSRNAKQANLNQNNNGERG